MICRSGLRWVGAFLIAHTVAIVFIAFVVRAELDASAEAVHSWSIANVFDLPAIFLTSWLAESIIADWPMAQKWVFGYAVWLGLAGGVQWGIIGLCFGMWVRRNRIRNRIATNRCVQCGYTCLHQQARCPECGWNREEQPRRRNDATKGSAAAASGDDELGESDEMTGRA